MKRAKKQGVYKITCLINDHCYIGQATDIYKRWDGHKQALDRKYKGYGINGHLFNAWKLYGWHFFKFEILEEIEILPDEKENEIWLNSVEQLYLDRYWDNCIKCYNIEKIANRPPSALGKKRSIETRQKMSIAAKNKSVTNETRQKISLSKKGKKLSAELCAKMSENMVGAKNHFFGKKHTIETIDKIKAKRKTQKSNKGIKFSEAAKNNMSLAHIGKRAFNRKLTDEQVREIKKLLLEGTSGSSISKIFDVDTSTISMINTGKSYCDVK